MTQVLFDVDGVLIEGYHVDPEFRVYWDETLEEDLGIPRAAFAQGFIFRAFKSKVLTGKTGLHEALAAALPEIGYRGDPQSVIDYWLEKDSRVNRALMDQVARLATSPGVTLYIASNQEHLRARYLMERLGFSEHFAEIFYSARLGHTKPNPRFYEEVLNLLPKSGGGPIILFDDDPASVKAARSLGIDAYQFNRVEDLWKSERIRTLLK